MSKRPGAKEPTLAASHGPSAWWGSCRRHGKNDVASFKLTRQKITRAPGKARAVTTVEAGCESGTWATTKARRWPHRTVLRTVLRAVQRTVLAQMPSPRFAEPLGPAPRPTPNGPPPMTHPLDGLSPNGPSRGPQWAPNGPPMGLCTRQRASRPKAPNIHTCASRSVRRHHRSGAQMIGPASLIGGACQIGERCP